MAAGLSFGMLAQIVRAAAAVVQEEKLAARIANCVAADELTRVVVFLREILGLLLDAALCHARELPLDVLALARSEIARVCPRIWEELGVQEVRIGDLGRRGVEQRIKSWLGTNVDKALVQRIVDRAAGNPFCREEIVHAVASGKTYQAMSGTVLAMVQARREEIASAERRTLRAASIFGDVFWTAGVTALLGGDAKAAGVKSSLGELVDREFVVRRSLKRFLDQEDFAFRNALAREADYSMQTDGDRMLGHRLVAAGLESVGEAEAMVLAQHDTLSELLRAAYMANNLVVCVCDERRLRRSC